MLQDQNRPLIESLAALELYRGLILDACELELGDSPRWPKFRSTMLKLLGRNGFEARLSKILEG